MLWFARPTAIGKLRLTEAPYKALGVGLQEANTANIWPRAIEGLRFLALTGWRRSEMPNLKWDQFDLKTRTAVRPHVRLDRAI
jgi:integrase